MKILFTDLDDTLLNRRKQVSPATRDAIHAAIAAGHKIVLTTGRPEVTALPLARELELDVPDCYLISFNGARVFDFGAGKPIFSSYVPLDYVKHVFQAAYDAGIHVHTYDSQAILTPVFNKETEWYLKRSGGAPYRVLPELPEGLEQEPNKVIFLDIEQPERLEDFRRTLLPWAEGKVDLFFSGPELLECVETGVNKGTAVRFLADHLGVPIEDTVAAGDSENDLPMLKAAGTGCAMINGTDACKAAADYITEHDCDEEGLKEIIDRFLLR